MRFVATAGAVTGVGLDACSRFSLKAVAHNRWAGIAAPHGTEQQAQVWDLVTGFASLRATQGVAGLSARVQRRLGTGAGRSPEAGDQTLGLRLVGAVAVAEDAGQLGFLDLDAPQQRRQR
jgi:hypothetical protein